MAEYRIYLLDSANHIVMRHDVASGSLEDAVAVASQITGAHVAVEIWCSGTLLCHVTH
jgi:hypothetical protein